MIARTQRVRPTIARRAIAKTCPPTSPARAGLGCRTYRQTRQSSRGLHLWLWGESHAFRFQLLVFRLDVVRKQSRGGDGVCFDRILITFAAARALGSRTYSVFPSIRAPISYDWIRMPEELQQDYPWFASDSLYFSSLESIGIGSGSAMVIFAKWGCSGLRI